MVVPLARLAELLPACADALLLADAPGCALGCAPDPDCAVAFHASKLPAINTSASLLILRLLHLRGAKPAGQMLIYYFRSIAPLQIQHSP
jgi:hypothetical protein